MKTPEQIAEEYLDQDKVVCDAINHDAEDLVKDAFLAGYKAAKDQLADADKVMDTCEHILDMEKMVDVNSLKNSNGWISVKDKLPEVGKEILWYHEPGGEFSVGLLHYEVEQPFFTHWMPLPAPPEEK